MSTSSLTQFLLARYDELEVVAQTAGGEWWMHSEVPGMTMRKRADDPVEICIDSPSSLIAYSICQEKFAEHISRHSPVDVLADIASKRAVVGLHPYSAIVQHWEVGCTCGFSNHLVSECRCGVPVYDAGDQGLREGECPTLMALAAAHSDHPDYDEKWKP